MASVILSAARAAYPYDSEARALAKFTGMSYETARARLETVSDSAKQEAQRAANEARRVIECRPRPVRALPRPQGFGQFGGAAVL